MAKTKAKRMTPDEQSARFREAAKQAEADEQTEAFARVFKAVARSGRRAKPVPRPK